MCCFIHHHSSYTPFPYIQRNVYIGQGPQWSAGVFDTQANWFHTEVTKFLGMFVHSWDEWNVCRRPMRRLRIIIIGRTHTTCISSFLSWVLVVCHFAFRKIHQNNRLIYLAWTMMSDGWWVMSDEPLNSSSISSPLLSFLCFIHSCYLCWTCTLYHTYPTWLLLLVTVLQHSLIVRRWKKDPP